MEESTIHYQTLPAVSARGTLLMAALGLACLGAVLFTGAALLIPAGLAGLAGLVTGIHRFVRVARGAAYLVEGRITLMAATFVSGSLALYVIVAGYIVLRFGA